MEPAPADVERLTPRDRSAEDLPLLAAAIAARATHFVTGDLEDVKRWMEPRARLPCRIMTPRQILAEARP